MTTLPRHPSLARFTLDWDICRACALGESEVKAQQARFLPPTRGMRLDGWPNHGTEGYEAYSAYLARAIFPSVFADALQTALGVLHRKPAVIDLPSKMEPLREHATAEGLSLEALLRQINYEQLVLGRLGLQVDPVPGSSINVPPNIVLWRGERVVNWNAPRLVVIDNCSDQIDKDDNWKRVEEHFRLSLDESGQYVIQHFRGSNFERTVTPSIGGTRLDFVPFTFVNAESLSPDAEEPPLIGLARIALATYRAEADYRQALFMNGQDSLVVIGGNSMEGATRVGAGSVIHVPKGGDAKYIGVSSSGLSEMRAALENLYKRAARLAFDLLDTSTRERESGEALKTRVAASTASLTQIANNGAAALQSALRQAATWMRADPDEVIVEPNLDFSGAPFDPKELSEIMQARQMGAPVSMETIHAWLREKDFAYMEFKDEIATIAREHDADLTPEDAPLQDDEE